MTGLGEDSYVLRLAAADALAAARVGKLIPIPQDESEPSEFSILDCFDESLRRSGLLLLDNGRTLQLLTADGGALAQPARRDGDFVADFEDGPVKRSLADVSDLRRLLAVGSGTMRRQVIAFVDEEEKTHCRVEALRLETADAGAAIVSLQGLKGYDKALAQLRRQVESAAADTDLYAMLFPARPLYEAKPHVPIGPADTAFDAATGTISAYLPVARANEFGVIADLDTEFLHDYRIALRKIRSVLSLFKGVFDEQRTEELKAEFSTLMAATGRLRDLDVYLLEKRKYFDLLPESLHPGLATLLNRFAAERAAEQAKLAEWLNSGRYEATVARLAKLFARRTKLKPGPKADRPAHDYASALIWKRYRKVCEIAAAIDADTDDVEVHRLRIQCKKLRYLMELFAPLFPARETKKLLKPLKRLQDNLGLFNDYSVQQESLGDVLRRMEEAPDAGDIEIAQSVGALVAVLHRLQREERAKVMASFESFDSPETRQVFRSLFKKGKSSA